MSFFDDCIITEIHLKSKIILKSEILKNYPKEAHTAIDRVLYAFNLVKFVTNPFPGFALYMRKFLGDSEAEFPDVEEKYVAFVIASEVSTLRLMEGSDLTDSDKTLLLTED